MPRARSRNTYQHISDFDKGRIVACRDYDLSYCSIAACVHRDPTDSTSRALSQELGSISRFLQHHTPVTTVDELWHGVEVALATCHPITV
ncbi:hypothetical protein TNCV_3272901 [Trichonephila clavipes]|nr:hypothetical protein TNCV_3272901 [Trichonephila clavipes]